VLPHGGHARGISALLVRVWGTPESRVQVRITGWPSIPLAETAPGKYQLVLQIETMTGQSTPPFPTQWVIDLEHGGHTVSALLAVVTPHDASLAGSGALWQTNQAPVLQPARSRSYVFE
jgi:hypothetical protein